MLQANEEWREGGREGGRGGSGEDRNGSGIKNDDFYNKYV